MNFHIETDDEEKKMHTVRIISTPTGLKKKRYKTK